MDHKHNVDNSSSPSPSSYSKLDDDDDDSSLPSPSTKDTKSRSDKDPPAAEKDDIAPPSKKSNESNSPESAPSEPPSKIPMPPKGSAPPTPSPSPPPPSSTPPPSSSSPPPQSSSQPPPFSSPPPPSSSPPPPSSSPPPPSASPPPPSSSPPPPSSSSPPPPPPFLPRAPPPPPSPSPPPSRGAPTNDSIPGNSESSTNQSSPTPVPPSGRGQAMHGGGGNGDNAGKYVAYTLAAVFFLALVALAIFMFRRKKSKGDNAYAAPPYMPHPNNLKFHIKPGVDRIYYGRQHSAANGPQSSHESNFGSGRNHGGSMNIQIAFSFEMMTGITDSFSSKNIIGEGGFGFVYKGFLPDGRAVAVKQLKAGSGQGEREFRAEVEIISRVHHRHLVSLVGYCISEQQRMLIYEYVPNGTLHHHLHGNVSFP